MTDTFKEAAETYLKQADYLTDDDKPLVKLLLALANMLDEELTAGLAQTFSVTMTKLQRKSKGGRKEATSEDEAFLENL